MDYSIFKAYDIRGVYPEQINKGAIYKIGRAFGIFVKQFYQKEQPVIAISRDIRKSSEGLCQELAKGLAEEGCQVIDIGLSTTPLNYFANWHLKADGSAMVTASHNPKKYNGIKFSLKGVRALAEVDGVVKTRELVKTLSSPPSGRTKGETKKINLLNEYIDFLKLQTQGINLSKFKIAVDCGNGMVGPIFEKLAKELRFQYKGLYMEPDGEFPNHEPNPLDASAIKGIQELIQKQDFDLGVLFDGDGDRFMALDGEGRLIKNDFLIGLFAKHYLPIMENKKVPCDARISRGAREAIKGWGGEVIKSKVGYPNLRTIMREEKAFFGGELSGHYFWQDFSYAESALLSFVRLLAILKKEKSAIHKLVAPMQKYFNTGEINFQVENSENKIKQIEERFSDGEIFHIDGVTVEYPNWWFNVRASNTEPLLRLLVEAKTRELLEEKVEELRGIIES
jgi:phosphomannomutase